MVVDSFLSLLEFGEEKMKVSSVKVFEFSF